MKEQMKTLLADYEAKGKERDALLGKGAGFTADDDAKVKAINSELVLMKSRFESMKAAAEDDFLKATAPKLELPTGTSEVKGILGWTPTETKESERVGPALNFYDVKSAVLAEFGQERANVLVSDNYKRAFFKMIIAGGVSELGATDRKDLEAGLDPQGGYTVPVDPINRLVQRKATPTRLAGLVTGIGTGSNAVEMPVVKGGNGIYPTGIRTSWVGEKPASKSDHRVNDADMFGKKRIDIHQLMLSIPLTQSLIEDSSFDLESWVAARFGEANDLETDRVILAGSGTNQPHGIITRARAAYDDLTIVNSGAGAALTYDGLVELSEGLPEQYDENARFSFAKTTTGVALRKLKDDNGEPLFVYGYADKGMASGRPRQLLGYDFAWSGFHESVAANNFPVVFGDHSGYTLARRIGFSVQVLRERYAEEGLVVLLGRSRFGGDVVEPWKMRVQKVSA
jgi:HK97 family phage major capsid protein